MFSILVRHKLLILILLLALFLRLYRLSELPIGFHADEARVAWNAFSILHTGADDRGNVGALYYNTFGDYRPTGIIYLTLPSIAFLGLNVFATRFPTAFLGALTVIPLYIFVLKVTNNKNAALFSSFFLSIIPWHITPSRSTSEVVVSLFFCLLGLVFIQRKVFWSAFLALSLSILFYHSARVVVPLFVLIFFLTSKTQKMFLLFTSLILLTLLLTLNSEARNRFNQVSFINDPEVLGVQTEYLVQDRTREELVFHNRPGFYLTTFLDEYSQYFGSQFLTSTVILPTRYASGAPLVSYTSILFILLGVVYLIKQQKYYFIPILLAISVIPTALTTEDAPNMHRALFMIPFLAGLAGLGYVLLQKQKTVTYMLLLVFCVQIFSFWHMYKKHSPQIIAASRNYGAFEVIKYLDSIDENYDTILLPNEPDSLYPWFAIHYQLNPREFNPVINNRDQGTVRYHEYKFTLERCPSDKTLSSLVPSSNKLLVVDRGGMCGVEQKIRDKIQAEVIHEIKYPDGTVAYTIWQGSDKPSTSTQ